MKRWLPLLLLLVWTGRAVGWAQEKMPEARAARDAPLGPLLKAGPILAPSYILVDADTGRILAERNAHARMYPASTTKTMMALVALSRGGSLDRIITVGPNAAATGEQRIGVLVGEKFTLRELLQAALIKSANDACVAIAEGVAGSVPRFVAMMNEKARQLGARDSHFANPHGLHDPNHYTTAYDLSLIARADIRFPFFNETVDTRQAAIHGNSQIGPTRLLVNKNRLLFRWSQCDGIKTGYTRQAGRCLVASASEPDPAGGPPWRLIGVVLHSPDSWSDSANLIQHEGFDKYRPTLVARAGQSMASVNVRNGAGAVEAVVPQDVRVPLLPGEAPLLTSRVHVLRLVAPVSKGTKIGYLAFSIGGRRIANVPLVAAGGVKVSLAARLGSHHLAVLPWFGGVLLLLLILAAATLIKYRANEKAIRKTARGRSRKDYQRPYAR